MKKTWLDRLLPYLFIMPSAILIFGIIFYPIALNVIRSFTSENGSFTLEHYQMILNDPIQQENILYTLIIVIFTVLLCAAIGYVMALYLRFSKNKVAQWMNNLYMLPRFVPGLVAVNGMITVLRDSGLINRISVAMGSNVTLGLMYDMKGIILMNLWFNIPFVVMLLGAGMAKIRDPQIEAAQDVGASIPTIMKEMVWPITYRDLLIALTFVFMSNVSSFTTPYLMGGNFPQMLGISLFRSFNSGEYEAAAAFSVLIFIFSALATMVYVWVNFKRPAWEASRKETMPTVAEALER